MSSATIGRWSKEIMKETCTDVDTFIAHSIRGAAGSTARDRDVSVQDILQTADWTKFFGPKFSNLFGKAGLNNDNLP